MSQRFLVVGFIAAVGVMITLTYGAVVSADNAWGDPPYHWARTTASFDLPVVNSTTNAWDPYVAQAVSDWSVSSSPLNMVEEGGSASRKVRRKCNPVSGKIRICNFGYGPTGWVGIAGVWIDGNGHITQAYTKLNDTYFNTSFYNNDP